MIEIETERLTLSKLGSKEVNIIKRLIVLALLLMCTALVEAAEGKIDEILDRISQEHDYPGVSLAVSYDDKVYFKQTGYADIAIGRSLNNETIFRMYSLTKGVTEILANLLVKNESLDLELPVAFYLPNIPIHLQEITVQHLLSHKSGIRHYSSNDEWLRLSQNHCTSPQMAMPEFINDSLISEPGEEINYTSFGYVLLSAVIEVAGKKPLEELMSEFIFVPSKALRIEFDNPENNERLNVTSFYEPVVEGYIEAPFVDNSCKFGAGAINASPESLLKVFSHFYSNNSANFPLPERISMGGEGLGGRSALIAYPKENLVVIVVANARGGNLQPYASEIAEALLE